jgi:hypothetical protein
VACTRYKGRRNSEFHCESSHSGSIFSIEARIRYFPTPFPKSGLPMVSDFKEIELKETDGMWEIPNRFHYNFRFDIKGEFSSCDFFLD